MVGWFELSIISAFFWAVGNLVDKFFLQRFFHSEIHYQVFFNLTNLAGLAVFYLLFPVEIKFEYFLEFFVFGLMVWTAMLFYFKALKKDEPDRVVALWYLSPIFIAILSRFILQEVFDLKEYIGMLLLVIGAVTISAESFGNYFKLSKAFWFMMVTNILTSLYVVILKLVMSEISPYTALFLLNLSFFFISFTVFLVKHYGISKEIKNLKTIGWLARSLGFVTYWLGAIAFYKAIEIGPVSLVNALNSFQPLFVFIFSLVFSVKAKYFRQKMDKHIILQKFVSIGTLIIGSFLIS